MEVKAAPIFEPIPSPRYTHKLELTIDEKVAEAYCREYFEEFFTYLYACHPGILNQFLDDAGDLVMDFLRGDEF